MKSTSFVNTYCVVIFYSLLRTTQETSIIVLLTYYYYLYFLRMSYKLIRPKYYLENYVNVKEGLIFHYFKW